MLKLLLYLCSHAISRVIIKLHNIGVTLILTSQKNLKLSTVVITSHVATNGNHPSDYTQVDPQEDQEWTAAKASGKELI